MLPQTFKRSFNMLLIVYYHTEEKKLSDNVITRYNVEVITMYSEHKQEYSPSQNTADSGN